MEVIVYTRPDCESSRRIKEILENRGVASQEHICADGKLEGKDLRNLDIEVRQVPLTVIDGVPIAGLQQAKIEQAIGWIGILPSRCPASRFARPPARTMNACPRSASCSSSLAASFSWLASSSRWDSGFPSSASCPVT